MLESLQCGRSQASRQLTRRRPIQRGVRGWRRQVQHDVLPGREPRTENREPARGRISDLDHCDRFALTQIGELPLGHGAAAAHHNQRWRTGQRDLWRCGALGRQPPGQRADQAGAAAEQRVGQRLLGGLQDGVKVALGQRIDDQQRRGLAGLGESAGQRRRASLHIGQADSSDGPARLLGQQRGEVDRLDRRRRDQATVAQAAALGRERRADDRDGQSERIQHGVDLGTNIAPQG